MSQFLLSKSFELEINARGRISHISGFDEITQQLKPPDKLADERAFVRLYVMLEKEVQEELWREYCGCFSFADSRVGDSWKLMPDEADSQEGPVNYRLERVDSTGAKKIAVVSYTAKRGAAKTWTKLPDGLQQKSSPYEMQGSALIDVANRRLLTGQASVTQGVRTRIERPSEKRKFDMKQQVSATNKLRVLTRSERLKNKKQGSRSERKPGR